MSSLISLDIAQPLVENSHPTMAEVINVLATYENDPTRIMGVR